MSVNHRKFTNFEMCSVGSMMASLVMITIQTFGGEPAALVCLLLSTAALGFGFLLGPLLSGEAGMDEPTDEVKASTAVIQQSILLLIMAVMALVSALNILTTNGANPVEGFRIFVLLLGVGAFALGGQTAFRKA